MEYRDDLKKLSWDALYCRWENANAELDSLRCERDRAEAANVCHVRQIRELQAELKAAQDALKAVPEPPLFEVGKRYRNGNGEIRGPLVRTTGLERFWVLVDDRGSTYSESGFLFGEPSSGDLIPGAVDPVPQWTPWPWLPDGEYLRDARSLPECLRSVNDHRAFKLEWNRRLRGYTSDPSFGRWQVNDGTATYLGE